MFYVICVCLRIVVQNTFCVVSFIFCCCIVCLRLVFPMLPVFLNCPFCIVTLEFSNVYAYRVDHMS